MCLPARSATIVAWQAFAVERVNRKALNSSAWTTSWREFRTNLRPILLLSVGLVLATTIVVAVVAHTLVGLPWPVAFVLGAVVSPTDAVAASATAKSVGLPRRLMTLIEGESMVNDATGLVVYRFAVAAVVTGSFSLAQASLQFVLVSVGGLLVGLVVGWPLAWLYLSMILGANFSSESGPEIPLNVSLLIRFGGQVTTKKGTTWLFANEKGAHAHFVWWLDQVLRRTRERSRAK